MTLSEVAKGIATGIASALPAGTGAVLVLVGPGERGVELAYASTFQEGHAEAIASTLVLVVGPERARALVQQAGGDVVRRSLSGEG